MRIFNLSPCIHLDAIKLYAHLTKVLDQLKILFSKKTLRWWRATVYLPLPHPIPPISPVPHR